MHKTDQALLARWVARYSDVGPLDTHVRTARNVRTEGAQLSFRNERFEEVARYVSPPEGLRFALVVPPELGALKVTRRLVRMLREAKVPFIVVRVNVLDAAGIFRETIRPIAVSTHDKLFTPADSVFQATCMIEERWDRRSSRRRTAFFLSGYDRNELFPAAFLCELPPGSEPVTIEDAYEALKPEAVKLAESTFRRKIKRQGDIFAIPAPSFGKEPGLGIKNNERILGTNHVGTEVVIAGGLTYARGKLKHRPFRRDPDHKTLNLGRTWHLLAKNTVPLAR